jgi:glycosidase
MVRMNRFTTNSSGRNLMFAFSALLMIAFFIACADIQSKSDGLQTPDSLSVALLPERVEPLFWWTGMKEQRVQVKFYGQGMAETSISVKYPGVKIQEVVLTDNPNFQFIYLEVGRRAKPGVMRFRLEKNGVVAYREYELKQRVDGSAQRESFSAADAVYLIMPDRFANGNLLNDSVPGYHQGVDRNDPGARHGGDLEGIIQRLPYLADLGITALWTTPVFDNNDVQYSYHHYGCSDYYRVDPRLGSNEVYQRLGQEAREQGIKLILDVVPNHCSTAHWWMQDMPAHDWFNQWDSYTSSNYRMMTWMDPHRAEKDLHRLTHGWFAPNMPDFNLQNELLFDYLKQVYVFWIEYVGITGLRVDTYPYNDLSTAARFIQSIRNEYPNLTVVGECWLNTPQELAYFMSGNNNKDGFDSRLHSIMDFPLGNVFQKAFTEAEGWNEGMARFYMHFALDFAYPRTDLIMNFLDNHDIDRYSLVVNGDVRLYKMALAMLTTVRGYPQIYYGDEIMMDGYRGSYEGHRFNFPGGWPDDAVNAFEHNGRTAVQQEVFEWLQKLLHYRKSNPVLHNGAMKQFIPEDGVYVYFRYNVEDALIVVVNNNEEQRELSMERFDEMIKGVGIARDIMSNEEFNLQQPLSLSARSVRLLEYKKVNK